MLNGVDKTYLGDSVYVDLDGIARVRIYIEDGVSEPKPIVLEDEVLNAFIEWGVRIRKLTPRQPKE